MSEIKKNSKTSLFGEIAYMYIDLSKFLVSSSRTPLLSTITVCFCYIWMK